MHRLLGSLRPLDGSRDAVAVQQQWSDGGRRSLPSTDAVGSWEAGGFRSIEEDR
jgi:hypothetical protein